MDFILGMFGVFRDDVEQLDYKRIKFSLKNKKI
jgi:hypothetical protein